MKKRMTDHIISFLKQIIRPKNTLLDLLSLPIMITLVRKGQAYFEAEKSTKK